MNVVYAVEVGDCGEQIYCKNRSNALAQGKREKRSVFRCDLAADAVVQLLNQQGRFIEKELKSIAQNEALITVPHVGRA